MTRNVLWVAAVLCAALLVYDAVAQTGRVSGSADVSQVMGSATDCATKFPLTGATRAGALCWDTDDDTDGDGTPEGVFRVWADQDGDSTYQWEVANFALQSGAAGGDLTGTYPSPTIADNALSGSEFGLAMARTFGYWLDDADGDGSVDTAYCGDYDGDQTCEITDIDSCKGELPASYTVPVAYDNDGSGDAVAEYTADYYVRRTVHLVPCRYTGRESLTWNDDGLHLYGNGAEIVSTFDPEHPTEGCLSRFAASGNGAENSQEIFSIGKGSDDFANDVWIYDLTITGIGSVSPLMEAWGSVSVSDPDNDAKTDGNCQKNYQIVNPRNSGLRNVVSRDSWRTNIFVDSNYSDDDVDGTVGVAHSFLIDGLVIEGFNGHNGVELQGGTTIISSRFSGMTCETYSCGAVTGTLSPYAGATLIHGNLFNGVDNPINFITEPDVDFDMNASPDADQGSVSVTITDNDIRHFRQLPAITVRGGSTGSVAADLDGVIISGNTIDSCGERDSTVTGVSFVFSVTEGDASARNVTVSDNKVVNCDITDPSYDDTADQAVVATAANSGSSSTSLTLDAGSSNEVGENNTIIIGSGSAVQVSAASGVNITLAAPRTWSINDNVTNVSYGDDVGMVQVVAAGAVISDNVFDFSGDGTGEGVNRDDIGISISGSNIRVSNNVLTIGGASRVNGGYELFGVLTGACDGCSVNNNTFDWSQSASTGDTRDINLNGSTNDLIVTNNYSLKHADDTGGKLVGVDSGTHDGAFIANNRVINGANIVLGFSSFTNTIFSNNYGESLNSFTYNIAGGTVLDAGSMHVGPTLAIENWDTDINRGIRWQIDANEDGTLDDNVGLVVLDESFIGYHKPTTAGQTDLYTSLTTRGNSEAFWFDFDDDLVEDTDGSDIYILATGLDTDGDGTADGSAVGTDAVGTDELADGTDNALANECVKVATGATTFKYEDCAGGSTGQVQYNSSGELAGESTFSYSAANNRLTVEQAWVTNTGFNCNTLGSDSDGDICCRSTGGCTAGDFGDAAEDSIRVEDGDNAGTFTDAANADFDDDGDINWKLVDGGANPDVITATIRADAVDLTTHTTGNYVASVATTAPVTGGAAGSEGATLTIGLTQNAGTDVTADLEEEGQINATAVTGNAADDQVLLGSGASALAYATIPDCNTNNMLTYTQATNTWGCDADDGAGGGDNVLVDGVGANTNADFLSTGDIDFAFDGTSDTDIVANINADKVAPDELADGTDNAVAGECVKVAAGGTSFEYATCASGVFTDIDTDYADETVTSTWNFSDNATGAFGAYDVQIGDVVAPSYGALQIGRTGIYSSSFSSGAADLSGALVFRQEAAIDVGNDPGVEFAFLESANTWRVIIPESGSGNAMNVFRSLQLGGAYSAATGNDHVLCDTHTTYDANIDCDTGATGPDLFVKDDIELEGTLFVSGGDIRLDSDDANQLTINATSQTASHTFTFPDDEIASGDVMFGSGAGTVSFDATPAIDCTDCTNVGDDVSVDGTAATDANFISTGDVDFAFDGTSVTDIIANVTDDSHNHTTTTVSGLDISDDTNLTAGRSLTLTGDDVAADAELYTVALGGIYVEDWAITDEFTFRLNPNAVTITGIECEAYSGTSFVIKVCAGEDRGDDTCTTNHLDATESTTLTCGTTAGTDTTINSGSVSARGKVTIVVTAVTGTVDGEVFIWGTVDD
jgi:hypothetical protein